MSGEAIRARLVAALWAVMPAALMILFVRIAWPDVPLGTYVDGAIQGLLVALVALGFVIVYRANRIVNFAAVDLGAAPATFAFLLWASVGWNVYLSLVLGLGSAVLLGVIVEFLFLRRFFTAPRLIVTVATIGVTELLVALGFFLPLWFSSATVTSFPEYFHADFTVSGVPFGGNDVLIVIVVPLVLLGLWCFFRFSAVGVALRATAENADRASLLGVPVRRLQSVVWGLAAVLAFVAMVLRIGVDGITLGQVLDPAVLLTALGAAVIGRMERMPTVVLAAVGLSIVDKGAVFHYPSTVYSPAIVAVIITIALLVQRSSSIDRLASAATSTWTATREIKPIPAELRDVPMVRAAKWALGGLLALFLVLVPVVLSDSRVRSLTLIGIYALIGLSLVVLTGWAGQVSLGQVGFVGIAGAVAGTLATRWHWDTALILIMAGVAGAVATIAVGIPSLRARGLAFAVITLAFSLATFYYLLNIGYSPIKSWLPQGEIPRTHVLGLFSVSSDKGFYVLVIVVLGASLMMVRSLRNSRIGRVLIGVRDNERAAQAFAIGSRGVLVIAFGVSGFLAGLAGGLFVLQQQALDAPNFSPQEGLRVFSMGVVGGLGSIGGAVLGAVYVEGTRLMLTQPQWTLLSSGVGLLLILLILPGGLGAAAGDARDALLRWYAKRKHIRVPSLLADTRVVSPTPASADLAEAVAESAQQVDALAEVRE
ncbi:MAG TPA: ABC transporter permease [Acidimicrobiia bacterium]|nr:ABC transporter permease [Acidimicrobiia bacterium]